MERSPWVAGFTAAHAWEVGLSAVDIRRSVRRREWVRLRKNAYLDAAVLGRSQSDGRLVHALEVSALLATLACDAVIGHASAAQVWGIATLRPPPRELTILTDDRDRPARRQAGYAMRVAALPPEHHSTRHGIPITTAARTVVDVARTSPFADGVVAVDSALQQGLTDVIDLGKVLDACRGWPGIRRARQVVSFGDPGAESVLESISRVAMHAQGVPMPRTQVAIGSHRVDFLWDDVKVIGEADGLAKYAQADGVSIRDALRAEKRREEWLADAGYEIIRWGWEDARNPPRLARRLCAALARGAERQRGRPAAA